jgi:RNA polymerase primary sigma factor
VAPPPAAPAEPAVGAEDGGEGRVDGELDDEDEYENAISLAAMEAELKPKILETFDNIAATYKKLRKLEEVPSLPSSVGQLTAHQTQHENNGLFEEPEELGTSTLIGHRGRGR